MEKVLVTGVTGKSGTFFYKELCQHAEELADYEFSFVVRNKEKAEALLNCPKLNQRLLIGSLADKEFVSEMYRGGGKNSPSYCEHSVF